MIIENTFSQKEFESTFLNGDVLPMNKMQIKRRKRLLITKLNDYEYEATKTYFFVRFVSADVRYLFNTEGYIKKISMKISWIQDVFIYFFMFPLIFLGLEYFEDKSITPLISFLPVLLGIIAFFYGFQVWFYFYSTKDIKSDIELEMYRSHYNISD